jgi:glutaredoxin
MKYYKILGRETCPWCCKACEVLKDESFDFMFCEMEHSPDLIDYWKEEYNMSTVPIIIEVDTELETEHLIGGCTDLIKYLGESDEESE